MLTLTKEEVIIVLEKIKLYKEKTYKNGWFMKDLVLYKMKQGKFLEEYFWNAFHYI